MYRSPQSVLNPKAAMREKHGSPSKSKAVATPTSPGKSSHDTPNGTAGIQRPDPKLLLNPKASRSATASKSQPSGTMDASGDSRMLKPASSHADSGRRSDETKQLYFDLYNIENRSEQPRKRVKLDSSTADETDTGSRSTFVHRSSGIVGDYLKPNEDENAKPPTFAPTVDLTNDDDDDVLITKTVDLSPVVCFGQVQATILAYLVPKPQGQSKLETDDQWPPLRCTLNRKPRTSDNENMIIEVSDPTAREFGRVSPDLAVILAKAMDSFLRLRTQVRLHIRKKRGTDWPHQACSEKMRAIINVYGRKSDSEKIGRLFGQSNQWFQNPAMADKGVEVVNPHARKVGLTAASQGPMRRGIVSESRTLEEATEAVSRLFDYSASTRAALETTEAPDIIVTPLLEHQKQALTFMLERESPRKYGNEEAENNSLWRLKIKSNGRKIFKEVVSGMALEDEPEEVFGGLLADVMGLGKTIEALALVAATAEQARQFGKEKIVRVAPDDAVFLSHTRATLLVSPLSTIKNWEDQIAEHVKPGCLKYTVYHGPTRQRNPYHLANHDIVITTYGTIAAELLGKSRDPEKASPIAQLKWFRIILDEAHTIREQKATQSQAIFGLWAQRRWCLTGTPIQNRIDDLGSLTRFLHLYPYDTAHRFNQYIRSPAQSGDASFLKALRVFVDSFTLRRLRDRVDLPKRHDLIELLQFSPAEKKLHDFFKAISNVRIEEMAKDKEQRSALQHHVLQGIMTLRLICAHGRELLNHKDLEKLQGTSETDAIDVEEEPPIVTITKQEALEILALRAEADVDMCQSCDKRLSGDSPSAELEDDQSKGVRCYVLSCKDVVCSDCFQEYKNTFDRHISNRDVVECPFCSLGVPPDYVAITGTTAQELETVPDDTNGPREQEQTPRPYTGPHTKTRALLRDINEMQEQSKAPVALGEPPLKCVVFSEFTSHLDLIGRALHDDGKTFLRIDGSMTLNRRKKVMDDLNTDDSVTILLASIKAAGQGLNLTAASRAFIMEPMWNPAAEAQAVDRIYRIGQKREVIIKRFQMADSIELKIVELQKRKQALADVSMNRNHSNLSKKESREAHFNEIKALFR